MGRRGPAGRLRPTSPIRPPDFPTKPAPPPGVPFLRQPPCPRPAPGRRGVPVMSLRRVLAASVLALGAVVLAAQVPADLAAQDAKAKKALKQNKAKKAADAVKPPPAPPDAKPAPTDIKPPAAPARPMPAAALAQRIDSQINQKLRAADVRTSPQSDDA